MAVLTVVPDDEALAVEAAERITRLLTRALDARGAAIVCLTGGNTPRYTYSLLGDASRPWRDRIDWPRVHVFWGDERQVPPDHPESNYGMAYEALLSRVPIPSTQIYRIRAELPDPHDASTAYEAELRRGFAAAGRLDETFDVMLLGIGSDAHIASVFPGSELLEQPEARTSGTTRRVTAAWVPHLSAWRITLTPPALLDAGAILVLASGEEKAPALAAAIELPEDVTRWPAQLLRRAGKRVEWILDAAAASDLRSL